MLKKGTIPVGGVQGVVRKLVPGRVEKECPTLWEHLTATTWPEDGSPRETSSLLVFVQDGTLKAMVRDKNHNACLWVAAQSLTSLLCVLEQQLSDPAADWREDRASGAKQARRMGKGS